MQDSPYDAVMAEPFSATELPDRQQLSTWVEELWRHLELSSHRAAIVVSGDKSWCLEISNALISAIRCQEALWISDNIDNALPPGKTRTQLGKEYNAIVFDDVPNEKFAEVNRYFLYFGKKINLWLDKIGYQYCKGEIMAGNPQWCREPSVSSADIA